MNSWETETVAFTLVTIASLNLRGKALSSIQQALQIDPDIGDLYTSVIESVTKQDHFQNKCNLVLHIHFSIPIPGEISKTSRQTGKHDYLEVISQTLTYASVAGGEFPLPENDRQFCQLCLLLLLIKVDFS